jgi:competence ComEA-like helix-hairpin-helix protein
MKSTNRLLYAVFGAVLLMPLMAAIAGSTQEAAQPAKQELPPGEGKDLLTKDCTSCHQVSVITSQHKSESKWTDTVVEMRNRGAEGSDEDMEKIIHYLAANFGPQDATAPAKVAKVNVNTASASDIVTGLSLSQASADAIVAYRTKNGKFKDIDSLKQVPGVEAAKIDAVKDKIEF